MSSRPKAGRQESGWPALRHSAALDPRDLEAWHLDFEELERADHQHVRLSDNQQQLIEAATADLLSLSKAWRSGGKKQKLDPPPFRELQSAYAAGGLQRVQEVLRPFLDDAKKDERKAKGRGGRGFYANLPSGWLSLRELRSAASSGRALGKCLAFFCNVAEIDAALAKTWGDEIGRRSAERARRMFERLAEELMGLSPDELKQEAAKLVPVLTKHYQRRFGRRGNQSNPYEDAFIRVADRIWHDAGGTGRPSHRQGYWRGRQWIEPGWKGGSTVFVLELMRQGWYAPCSQSAIAQRIYSLSKSLQETA